MTYRAKPLTANVDATQAARFANIWEFWPHVPDQLVPELLGIPDSLWGECKRQADCPPLYNIRKRLFVRTADLKKWLDEKAEAGAPGSRPMRKAALAARAAEAAQSAPGAGAQGRQGKAARKPSRPALAVAGGTGAKVTP